MPADLSVELVRLYRYGRRRWGFRATSAWLYATLVERFEFEDQEAALAAKAAELFNDLFGDK